MKWAPAYLETWFAFNARQALAQNIGAPRVGEPGSCDSFWSRTAGGAYSQSSLAPSTVSESITSGLILTASLWQWSQVFLIGH
ncbi:hypothetical protein BC827DRAFT_1198734 [Russula dissimulans]|nr:hypothetical protein BC827DRAFT_1198734 [Russula dissimulans]